MTAADRVHRPTHTLSASHRRADLIDPRRSLMPASTFPPDDRAAQDRALRPHDDLIRLDLVRHGERWTARPIYADPHSSIGARLGSAEADGPAEVLEALGQELDAREAQRLTREARGEAVGQITVEEAVERALAADVATVLEVLEETARHADDAGDAEVTTGDVAQRAGFVTDAILVRHGATRATLELVDEAERRARRALERGVQDGVIVRRDTAELWRAATVDELERAVERNLDGAEDDAR